MRIWLPLRTVELRRTALIRSSNNAGHASLSEGFRRNQGNTKIILWPATRSLYGEVSPASFYRTTQGMLLKLVDCCNDI
jgi:hypothetical protein